MKKGFAILMSAIIALEFTACSNNSTSSASGGDSTSSVTSSQEEKGLEVNKGLLDVTVTLPASFFEGSDFESIKKSAEEKGVKSITQNADGSVTYKMSKAEHKKMMDEMKTSTTETLKGYITDTNMESITDVSFNDDFSQIKISVDKEKYENSMDSFAVFGAGLQGMFYQIFDGRKEKDVSVKIDVVDNKTGNILDSTTYPEAFNDSSSSQ